MTALFIILTIFGVVEVVSMLVLFIVLPGDDRENPPFRLMAQAVGFVAAGVGGLAMTWADVGTYVFSIVTVVSWLIFMPMVYKFVLPDVRKRREARIRASYIGLSATITRCASPRRATTPPRCPPPPPCASPVLTTSSSTSHP
jgi:hypothetical protein